MTDEPHIPPDTDPRREQEIRRLRALVEEGLASGPATPVTAEDWEELRAIASGHTDDFQAGTVVRLNVEAGFGYVADAQREHFYIFVFGKAIKHRQAGKLAVGMPVRFKVSEGGRVDELLIEHA